jgi:hypothetical protein
MSRSLPFLDMFEIFTCHCLLFEAILVWPEACHKCLRIKVTADVVLSVSKSIHLYPMTQGIEFSPYSGVVLFNPRLDPPLSFDTCSCVKPIAQSRALSARGMIQGGDREVRNR